MTDPTVNRRKHRATRQTWQDYLEWFHHDRPGITTDTLGTAHHDGIDPYHWALEPLGPPPPRLIDIACGDAPIFDRSPSPGWVGVDTSNAELRQARRHGAQRLIRADVTQIPLATGSAPAVICSMALMIVQPLDAVLAEIRRVLTPDGTAVALLPGGWPLTARDLYRYAQLMITLRRPRLTYPNDHHLTRLRTHSRQAGLEIVDDRRRRFALPLPDNEAAERFVASLYLPGVHPARNTRATWRAAQWVPGAIGIPLRRITLRPQDAPRRLPTTKAGEPAAMGAETGDLAETVMSAMANADLDAFLNLCAEDVHWGAPGDSRGGCHNRDQVRSWYESAFGRGVRAEVTEIIQGPTSLLVGLTVSGSPSAEEQGGGAERWQVLTIQDGRITDICGFDDRTQAATWAGMTP